MAITQWNPWNIYSPSVSKWPGFWDHNGIQDSVSEGLDVYETESDVVVEAAMPGFTEDEVNITFEEGILRVFGQKSISEEDQKKRKNVYRAGRADTYEYMTTLPRSVDAGEISAEIDNGIVKVKAPIAQESKPRQIKATKRKKSKNGS